MKICNFYSNKTFIVYLLLVLFVVSGQNLFAQRVSSKRLHEQIKDRYMPPARNAKRTPAYRYESSLFFTTQVNIDENGNNITGDAANEPSIAIDPTNPDRIVIGWRQFDNVSSNFRQAGYAYSEDGGDTWTFPGVVIDQGKFRSDPVLDYDAEGNFYYNSLGVDEDDNMWCDVFRITDGGVEWDNGVYAQGGDKQWMRIDRTASEGKGNIYASWNQTFSVCANGSYTRSTDEGESYENCLFVDGNPYWSTMAVGPDGELYEAGACYDYNDGVIVVKSVNAKYEDSTTTWITKTWVPLNGQLLGWSNINPAGLLGQAWIDVDKSNGSSRGYVYVMAAVQPLSSYDPGDIMFSRSTDGGLTWDDPVRINDDSPFDYNTQWMGTMSVAPDGRIDVIWLDTRMAPSDHPDNSALYYSYSTDHGVTWSANEKLSDLFDPHVGYPNQNKMGDYFDMVSDETGAHLAWANTLNGEEDVYYAHITPGVVVGINNSTFKQKEYNLRNYPNPSSNSTSIHYYLPSNSYVSLSLYDSFGKKVKTLVSQNQLNGSHKIAVDVSEFHTGIYYAKLKVSNIVSTTKLVIIR